MQRSRLLWRSAAPGRRSRGERRGGVEEMTREAMKQLNDILESRSIPLKRLLTVYRKNVRFLVNKRKKIANPVNSRTGEPLKPATIKYYRSELRWREQAVKDRRDVIKALAHLGWLGHRKSPLMGKIHKTIERPKLPPLYVIQGGKATGEEVSS